MTQVPVRSKSGTCPATQRLLPPYAAKRPPGGQRDDGFTCNGRLTARRERIFLNKCVTNESQPHLWKHVLETETLPSELLPRLRRHQETGPPAPAILLMSVHHTTAQRIHTTPARTKQMPERKKPMPNNASTKWGRKCLVLEIIKSNLTTLRPVYVPLRSKSGSCPATRRLIPGYGAKRHPDGQRADGLTHDGRLTARRERIFTKSAESVLSV